MASAWKDSTQYDVWIGQEVVANHLAELLANLRQAGWFGSGPMTIQGSCRLTAQLVIIAKLVMFEQITKAALGCNYTS